MDTNGQVEGISSVTETEKLIPQSEVNRIVAGSRKEAKERAEAELQQMQARYQAELEKLSSQQAQAQEPAPSQTNEPANMDHMYDQWEQRLFQKAQEQQARQAREAEAAELESKAATYFEKMNSGPELFEDFNEVMADFDPQAFPQVVFLAAEMENTPQVMYELAKNPQKLGMMHVLAQADVNQAKKALKRISESIAYNEQAQDEYVPTRPPVSAPKPSQVGKDKGYNSISDYKNASWLKG